MKILSWFTASDFSELVITKYQSAALREVLSTVSIKEKTVINEIENRIKSLPVDGDEMKKMGPKSKLTTLSFFNGKTWDTIEIYGEKFKTPSTGFLSDSSEIESVLVNDIEAMVAPELGSRLPKIKNSSLKFKNFNIKFVESIHTPQPVGGPTIGPTNRNMYSINAGGSANEVILSIFDGQLPPQSQAFVMSDKIYYLLTYQTLKKESLGMTHFLVSDKKPSR